jgi:hypothetical protein
MEDVEWRLINVFSIGDGKMLGAYCSAVDFEEGMLELSRKALVVGHATVEVAPLGDIKTRVSMSEELEKAQAEAEAGGRRKRRRTTAVPVPKRTVKMVKKWTGQHDTSCMECEKKSKGLVKCYGCNLVSHKECAASENHNNILCMPNGSKRWVCNSCYFDTHGGGPEVEMEVQQ